jgi:hypothetical protein
MTETTLDTAGENTGVEANTAEESNIQDQAPTGERMFTQEEVNAMIAKRAEKMAKQKFGDIDVSEYQELKAQKEKAHRDELIRKQKFEEVLKQQKETYEQEVTTLRSQLTGVKVDGAVLDAATKFGAVSPSDVAALMKNNIQLDDTGNPVVLDSTGTVRYDPNTAEPMSVELAVKEFLDQKPYFRASNPAGAGSQANAKPGKTEQLTLGDLDMKNPEHRKMYAEMMDPKRTRKFYTS